VAQVVECLPSKHKAPEFSSPNTTKRKKREREREVIADNFPKLMKEINSLTQVHLITEGHLRHLVIVKLLKTMTDKNFKMPREKKTNFFKVITKY
jgi:hypothetical protein